MSTLLQKKELPNKFSEQATLAALVIPQNAKFTAVRADDGEPGFFKFEDNVRRASLMASTTHSTGMQDMRDKLSQHLGQG